MFYIADEIRVAFWGRKSAALKENEHQSLKNLIFDLMNGHSHIDFNVGYDCEFEIKAAESVKNAQTVCLHDVRLNLWLAYKTEEYCENEASFNAFFDWVLICGEKDSRHARRKRVREMIDFCDLIVFCAADKREFAYRYAKRKQKRIVDIMHDTK